MKPLTTTSVSAYNTLLTHTLRKPLFEMFLHIGVNLIELEPEEQYINVLVQSLVDEDPSTINELNMILRQLNDFYNDTIATYEEVDLFEPNEAKMAELEKVVTLMMSQQDDARNKEILLGALDKAVDTVAREYHFYDELYNTASYESLMQLLKEVVFEEYPNAYISFKSMMDIAQMLKKGAEPDDFFAFALMTTINLAMFNDVRKERFEMIDYWEEKIASAKVGRNEPCPCGSGKKYKKCCGRNG